MPFVDVLDLKNAWKVFEVELTFGWALALIVRIFIGSFFQLNGIPIFFLDWDLSSINVNNFPFAMSVQFTLIYML